MVDNSGNPLVMYHGTLYDFENFDDSKLIDYFWFSANPKIASCYPHKKILAVYLSVQNPEIENINNIKLSKKDGMIYFYTPKDIAVVAVLSTSQIKIIDHDFKIC